MKKTILFLSLIFLVAFGTPKITKEDVIDAIELHKTHGYVIPKKLQGDTIYYTQADTLFLLKIDYNYIPWVVAKRKSEQ